MQVHKSRRGFAVVQDVQEPSDAVTDAWVRLIRAGKEVVGQIEAELKGAGFPSLSWYDVLLHLKRRSDGRATPREIEEEVLFEQYNLSRLLDRMETEGLVRRIPYPGDRRRQLVEITDEGRLLQRRMWGVYGPAISRFVGGRLSDGEAEQLAALLLKLMHPENA
nr:MarR family winged helix-turn-helix transcriptional regulator [Microvirga calopogonii]